MTKERFYEGDLVDLVPQEFVRDDYGLGGNIWQQFLGTNPHIIKRVGINEDGSVCYYDLEDDKTCWSWPPDAFVLHVEPTIVEVGDLL